MLLVNELYFCSFLLGVAVTSFAGDGGSIDCSSLIEGFEVISSFFCCNYCLSGCWEDEQPDWKKNIPRINKRVVGAITERMKCLHKIAY